MLAACSMSTTHVFVCLFFLSKGASSAVVLRFYLVRYSFPGEHSSTTKGMFFISQCFQAGVFSSLSPPPPRLPLTHPICSSLLECQHGTFVSKNIHTPEENACAASYKYSCIWLLSQTFILT